MVHLMGRSRLPGLVVALVVTVLAAGSTASAQPSAPDPEFARLTEKLKPRDNVIVIDLQGRSVKGRFGSVSAEQITVLLDGESREFAAASVKQVKRQRMGVLLGALIGGGAGVVAGAFLAALSENEGGNSAAAALTAIGLGVGAGIAVDAAVNIPRTVYKRPAGQAAVVPVIGPGRLGAGLAVRF